MCWNDVFLIPALKDQNVGNDHNNATHIYSLEIHVGMVDMHIFLPWPYQILLGRYDVHVPYVLSRPL